MRSLVRSVLAWGFFTLQASFASAHTVDSIFSYLGQHGGDLALPMEHSEFSEVLGCGGVIEKSGDPDQASLVEWAERLDRFFYPLAESFSPEVRFATIQIYEGRGPRVSWQDLPKLDFSQSRAWRENDITAVSASRYTVVANQHLRQTLLVRRVELLPAALLFGLMHEHPDFESDVQRDMTFADYDLLLMAVRQRLLRQIPQSLWTLDGKRFVKSEALRQMMGTDWKLNHTLPTDTLIRISAKGRQYKFTESDLTQLIRWVATH